MLYQLSYTPVPLEILSKTYLTGTLAWWDLRILGAVGYAANITMRHGRVL